MKERSRSPINRGLIRLRSHGLLFLAVVHREKMFGGNHTIAEFGGTVADISLYNFRPSIVSSSPRIVGSGRSVPILHFRGVAEPYASMYGRGSVVPHTSCFQIAVIPRIASVSCTTSYSKPFRARLSCARLFEPMRHMGRIKGVYQLVCFWSSVAPSAVCRQFPGPNQSRVSD